MSAEYTVHIKSEEGEEKKEKDETFLSASSSGRPQKKHTSSIDPPETGSADLSEVSAVNMTGIVQKSIGQISSHSKSSSHSHSHDLSGGSSHQSETNHSVWESDLNDEDETSFGTDDDGDDDFYGTNGQEQAGHYPPAHQLNPHIQQEYPIPDPSTYQAPLDSALQPAGQLPPGYLAAAQQQQENNASISKLNPEKQASNSSSIGSKSSGGVSRSSRSSRRGSLRVPGDESKQAIEDRDEERRQREFQERLKALERQSSSEKGLQQAGGEQTQHPKESSFKCTKDIIPVAASLLLLAAGIAVAIYLLFGSSEDDDMPAPTPAPTFRTTAAATIDPNPFRRRMIRGYEP
ncbi:MAG: hypothetical protein SGBAC_010802 [Bacillariaceae sp.]